MNVLSQIGLALEILVTKKKSKTKKVFRENSQT